MRGDGEGGLCCWYRYRDVHTIPGPSPNLAKHRQTAHLSPMTEITARLSTALADRYRIERHLGEGGMATVYVARCSAVI